MQSLLALQPADQSHIAVPGCWWPPRHRPCCGYTAVYARRSLAVRPPCPRGNVSLYDERQFVEDVCSGLDSAVQVHGRLFSWLVCRTAG